MKAAVISAAGEPPGFRDIAPPVARLGELPVEVLASGLHHVTRARATGTLPRIAGMDGVGRDPDGTLRYFVQGPDQPGSMAERTVIDPRHSIVLPEGCDPVLIARAMTPAMASWFALRCRAAFRQGQRMLILGATGPRAVWRCRSRSTWVPRRSSPSGAMLAGWRACRRSGRATW